MAKKLSVDISEQAALGAGVPPETDITSAVFKLICQTADALHERGERRGVLIVIGSFASAGEVNAARGDLRPNPFKGQYVSAGDKFFQRMILQGDVADGAVVADESGQILGGGIYLDIDHPEADVPDGGFTRHLAAASTSLHKEVKSVIALSEETNVARMFEKGVVVATYDPAREAEEQEPQAAPAKKPAAAAEPPPAARSKRSRRRRRSSRTRSSKKTAAAEGRAERPESPEKADGSKAALEAAPKPGGKGRETSHGKAAPSSSAAEQAPTSPRPGGSSARGAASPGPPGASVRAAGPPRRPGSARTSGPRSGEG